MSAVQLARMLFDEAGYIASIASAGEYQQACSLLEELMDDAFPDPRLIGVLARSLAQWETQSAAFSAFNRDVLRLENAKEDIGPLE
ncbi:hypothetical protein R84981_001765 [Carnimonas sp. R-84981]|uniref:hypothetical protein n=1 Tax=Carnimonas bestiolae TaxID=3402172 RepID=UPI003EDB9DB4